MDRLGRGVVAVPQADGRVFVSWRMLGTDPKDVAFDVYRDSDGGPVQVNQAPLKQTCLIDATPPSRGTYFVRPISEGRKQAASGRSLMPAEGEPYLSVPLQTPDRYTPNDASVGDLDGDGEYEIVLHQVGRGRDNSQAGFTTEPILEAYQLDGTLLWRINLGRNIREGAHYTQFMVYDFDGDGRAEVACKTADGTIDGQGKVIGDAEADHRDARGYILSGPEFLTVFDGRSGAARATVDYLPPRGDVRTWGDDYGNRCDRFLACVAYLDGERPSLVMCRGYYTRAVLAAWDFRDGKLTSRWVFDSDDGKPENRAFRGQGNHNLSVADVDGDGRDEIIYGSCVIDDDGRGLFSTGLGHGDALHVSDFDPARPGLEVWGIHENERRMADKPGTALFNARTGEVLFTGSVGQDVARGMAADIDPRHAGAEFWGGFGGLRNVKGERIGNAPRSANMAIWWDGDLLRELLDGVNISKWDYQNAQEVRLLSGRDHGVSANNGSKSNPCLVADILGDWREELIARSADGRELRIFTTTLPTEHRFPTLLHDPHYRLSIAWQNVAYNQPPHTGFYLGHGMAREAGYVEKASLAAAEANQAAAADERFVYAIDNRLVAKYDRATGKRIATSSGDAQHLNSGFLADGKLYCAHSNYPRQPAQSEIMVLDTDGMRLSTFKQFGAAYGSLTWAVRRGEDWWCNFAHYGAENHKTLLLKFDPQWSELGRWTYPAEVIAELGAFSISGGVWQGDDLLVTGHDKRVVYRLRLPDEGAVLKRLETVAAPFPGQGIAIDPTSDGLIGIDRAGRRVIFAERR